MNNKLPNDLKGLIFDCDGVIIDSRTANTAYYNQIRSRMGMPDITPDEEAFVHMATVDQAIFHIIPERLRGSAEMAMAMAFVRNNKELWNKVTLERHILEFLRWIKPCGLRLGICTNRIDPLHELLEPFNILPYFDTVKTAADHPPKPSPEGLLAILNEWKLAPEEVAYIGDSKVDEAAARSAGIPFLAYKNESLSSSFHIRDYHELIRELNKPPQGAR